MYNHLVQRMGVLYKSYPVCFYTNTFRVTIAPKCARDRKEARTPQPAWVCFNEAATRGSPCYFSKPAGCK